MLHDRAEGTELLLILTDLAAVGRVGLLDALKQLVDFLALAVELDIEAVIVAGKLGILSLQLDKLVGKILLVDSQVIDHLLPVHPHVCEDTCKYNSHYRQDYNSDFQALITITSPIVPRAPLRHGSSVYGFVVLFHFNNLLC